MPSGVKAGTVYLDVRPNLEGFEQQLRKAAEPAASKVSERLSRAGGAMANAGKRMSLAISAPLAGLGAVAINAASDLNESMSKVGVVFGDSADQIQTWAQSAAAAMGMSRQEALEAAGTYGNLFRAIGLTEQASAGMSQKLVGLAGDLSSFNNANPEDVLLALRAGLVGETEPLRRFGVNINAARLEAEALSIGLAKAKVDMVAVRSAQLKASDAAKAYADAVRKHGKGSDEAARAQIAMQKANQAVEKSLKGSKVELTAGQKAQAAYSVIMKDTALAQGDFERTADGVANRQRIVSAQFKDAAATLGQQLLPIGQKILGWASSLLQRFSALSPTTKRIVLVVAALVAGLGPLLAIIGNLTKVIVFFGKASTRAFLANPITLWIAAIVAAGIIIWKFRRQIWNALKAIGRFFADVFGKIRSIVIGAIQFIVDKWLAAAEWLLKGAAKAFGWVPGIGGKLKGAAAAFETFRDDVNAYLDGIKDPEVKVKIKGATAPAVRAPRAEFRARGGVLRGRRGGHLIVAGEEPGNDEAIIPLGRNRSRDRVRVMQQAGLAFASGGIVSALGGARQQLAGRPIAAAPAAGMRLIEGRLTIDERGRAWIRGLAAAEIDDERAFAASLGRMRR